MAVEIEGDRDLLRCPASSGAIITRTSARTGPSIPWIAHVVGGSYSVISEVELRFAPPIFRVMVQIDPTPGVPPTGR